MSELYSLLFLTVFGASVIKCFGSAIVCGKMRTRIVYACLAMLIGFAVVPLDTSATHISGSDITYRWLSGNSYEVTVTLYRDCSGVDADPNVTLNYRSASCGYNLNAILNPIAGTGIEITHPCSTAATTCSGGTNPGIQQYVYRGTITLPAQCTDWIFSYNVCARNCAITALSHTPPNCNGMPCLYVEATLNNVAAPANSSPSFTNIPVAFVCIGQAFNYNHGAVDANGDSLVYSFVTPKDNATTNVTYISGHSATQPLLSTPPMTINSRFGDISMTPTAAEVSVMAVLIREYRNGVLIGSIIRDIQVWTQACSNILPTATGINGTTNFSTTVCAGNPINFTITSHDNNATQIVSMSWNFGIPGATFNTSGSPYPSGTFSWTPTAADARAQPYTFTITVRDNNCPSNGFQIYSYSILVEKITASVVTTNSLCSGAGTGTASVSASGGTPVYAYLWSPGGGTTSSLTGLGAGNYSVTVTDSKGCSATAPATVASQSALLSNINSSSNVSCFGGSNGNATVSVSGGSSPYVYSWSPSGGNGAVASGLAAGNYIVTITDANNCTRTSTVSISQPSVLAASIPVHTNVSCFGGSNGSASVSVSGGTAPYNYSWSPSGGTVSNAAGLPAGNYSVVILDAHGCSTTASVSITQATALNLAASTSPATCGSANGNTSTSISGGTAPYNYLWSPGGATSTSLSNIAAGAYSVTVTDAKGCIISAAAGISNVGGPSASIASLSPVTCFGGNNGSASVSVSGGTPPLTYTWFPSGGNAASATGLASGNYTVTIHDGNNCSSSVNANVTQPTQLQLNPFSSDLTCFGSANGSASVIASGGNGPYSYLWSPGGITSQALSGIPAGTYSATVTDLHGCAQTTSTIVSQPASLSAAIASAVNVSCFGNNNGSAIVTPSGGTSPYVYSWSPSGGAAAAAAGLAAGNYTVTIADANNCTRTASVSITQPAVLAAAPSATNVLCSGGSGSASVVASGGTSPYSYSWSPTGGTAANASGLLAGNYTIAVTDARNCIQSAAVSIAQPATLVANMLQSSAVSCFGGNNGSAAVSVSGGTSPYNYQWSPTGGTNSTATGLVAGNYTVAIRDAHNCTQTVSVFISQPAALAAFIPLSTQVSCFGGNNGSATVSVSGGTAPYSYNWSAGNISDTATATGLAAGNYSVSVSDALGCNASTTISMTQPTALNLSSSVSSATCGSANGSASASASGGSGPYSFLWSPTGATSSSLSGVAAGAYSVTVTDAHGCLASASAAVSNIGGPSAAIAAISPVSCFSGNNGSASVSVSGGTPPFSYTWFPSGGTTSAVTGLTAGNYTVTIRDGNNCSSSVSANVTQASLIQLNMSSVDLTCFGSSNGNASVAVSGGTGSYSYVWSPGGSTSQSLNGIAAGNYSVTVTDLNGCSQSSLITVAQPTALSASISTSSHVSCYGNNNGAAAVVANGGTSPYFYSWSPTGGTAPTASGLPAGNYTATVRDANNCLQNTTVSIYQPAVLSLVPSVTNASCAGGTGSASVVSSGGTSPYSFIWSPTGGTAAIATGLAVGNYSVTITDAHNCLQSSSVSISQPAILASSIPVSTSVSCFGSNNGSATVAASGGTSPYAYSWSPSGETAAVASGLAAGNYTVTVTDAHSCIQTSSVSISQPALLAASIPVSSNVSCFGRNNGSASVAVSGGTSPYLFAWSPSGGNAPSATGLLAGNYSVTITDAHNCATASTISIVQPTSLNLATSTSPATCGSANGSVFTSLSGGTGPYAFLWSPSGATSNSLSGVVAGAYLITVTDANGCSSSASAAVSNIGGPSASIAFISPVSCFGNSNGSATVSVSGGTAPFTYSWFPSGGNSAGATGLAAGNYTVTIRDGNNCSSSVTANITQPNLLQISPSSINLTCYGSANGSASVSASGGAGSYSYLWSPGGSTSQSLNGITAGNYSATVTDLNGCSQSSSITISQPTLLSASISSFTSVSCYGSSDGAATVVASGGTSPYSYSWSPSGRSAASTSGLVAGNYSITIRDANNCIQNTTVSISQPAVLSLAPSATNASCAGGTGSASVVISGGTSPYSYAWSPSGGTAASASGLASGNYVVTITDAHNCLQSSSFYIAQPPLLLASIPVSSAVSCFGSSNGSATATASGGTSPYVYSWSPSGGTAAVASGLTTGNYSVTVTDANNCLQSSSVSISQPALLIASIPTSINVSCFDGSNGSASVSAAGGTAPYFYAWSPSGGNAPSATGLVAGNYAVTITDAYNCTAGSNVSISQPIVLNLSASTLPATCGSANGSASTSLSGGTGLYAFLWSPSGATSSSQSGLAAGAYAITVTDALGCTISTSAAVSNIGGPSATISSLTSVSCFGGNNGSAAVSVSSGTSPYTYAWFPAGGTSVSATGLAAGNYAVSITDANNCLTSIPVTINQPIALAVITSFATALCNGDANGSASATVSGGTAPYSYSWNSGSPTSSTFINLIAGNYSITVTDLNGCSQSSSITVSQPTVLSASISNVTNVTCFGNSNGSASVVANGGTSPYSYSWSPSGGSASTASGLAAGNYAILVRDANNCIQNTTVSIAKPTALALVPAVNNVSCTGGTGSASVVTTGGTSPYSYAWSPTGGAAATASGLPAGNYTVTVTDAHNCLRSSSLSISQPPVLSASIPSSSAVSCYGGSNGSATAAASGGTTPYVYSWSPSGGTAAIASGLAAGNYAVTVTDANSCIQTSSVLVSQPALLIASIPSSTNVSCFGSNNGSASVSAFGGTAPYSYAWFPSGGNAPSATGLAGGNYSVTVTDALGCNASTGVDINNPAMIVLNTYSTPARCNGSSDGNALVNIVSGGTAPFFYNWIPLGGNSSAAVNLPAGVYTVAVNDGHGCLQTASVSVNQPSPVSLSINSSDVSCFGNANGSASVFASGGTSPYSYLWLPTGNTSVTLSGVSAGQHSVIVTDYNGCHVISGVTIDQPDLLSLDVNGSATICIGQSATLSSSVSGGTAPYVYQWSNGNSGATQNVSPSTTTSYLLNVLDANGCSAAQQNLTVTVNPPLAVLATGALRICEGNPALINAVASGGDGGPYSYSWNQGILHGSSISVSPVHDTTFTVIVTDGCGTPAAMDSAIVIVNRVPAVSFLPHLIQGCTPVLINFSDLSTAPAGSSLIWNFGDNTVSDNPHPSHQFTNPGHYDVSLFVISPEGCSGNSIVPNAVTVYGYPKADFVQSTDVVPILNSNVIFTDKSIDAIDWEWDFGDSSSFSTEQNPVHEYADTGNYKIRLAVESAGGCVDTSYRFLRVEDQFTIYIPNAFTPNGDGINDGFIAFGVGYADYDMWIIDRWGKKIFHSTNKTQPWDGTFYENQTLCQNDVYEYVINVHDKHGKEHAFIGHVTLVR